MKKRISSNIIFLVMALFCYIEYVYINNKAFVLYETHAYSYGKAIAVIMLFLVCAYYDITNFKLPNRSFAKPYMLTYLLVITLTFFHFLFYPMESQLIPFLILLSPLLFLFIISYYSKNEVTKFEAIFFLSVFIFLTYRVFSTRNVLYAMYFSDNKQINTAYTLLYMLPLCLCFKNNLIKFGAIFIVGLSLILTFKRAGLIAFALGIIAYILVSKDLNKKRSQFLGVFIIGIGLIVALRSFLPVSSDDILFLSDRFDSVYINADEDRGAIYYTVINRIASGDVFSSLLGHGWDSLVRIIDKSAHNDFLEIIYDFGWLVFFIYIFFVIKLISYTIKMYKNDNEYAGPLAVSVSVFLVNSNLSHIFLYPENMMSFALFWGFVLGNNQREAISINIKRKISRLSYNI